MREITDIKEIKEIELNILKFFADFCEKNGLRYFLAFGTLIGAVRHKGFIPWDDDIDVYMPKDDYEKLHKIFKETDKYKLIYPLDKQARHTIIKIIDKTTLKIEKNVDYSNGELGADIDIFPLTGAPENKKELCRFFKKLHRHYSLFTKKIINTKTCRIRGKIYFSLIQPFINKRKQYEITEKIHSKYDYNNSKFICCYACLFNSIRNVHNRECFDSYVYLDFEGERFRAPKKYDEILRSVYGDYMKLPPVEKQAIHHSYKLFDKNS